MGKPNREVVALAEGVGVGLIVVGSRGHGGIRRALMGSVSDSVVRHAHCPFIRVSHGSLRKVEPQPSRSSTMPWSRTREG